MLILFDLWGTLLIPEQTLFNALSSTNVVDIKNKTEFIRLLEENVHKKDMPLKEGIKDFVKALIKKDYKLLVPVEEVEKKFYEVMINNSLSAIPRKGLWESLNLVRKVSKIAIISNTSKDTWNIVNRKFRIKNYVDACFLSFEMNLIKPDPRVFIKAMEFFKENSENTYMVGDSYYSDYLPARKLGINAILIRKEDNLLDVVKKILNERGQIT